MRKIFVIIQREYISRVRNKTFLLSTFLFPLFLVAVFAGSAYLTKESMQEYKIAVKDPTGRYQSLLKNEKTIFFSPCLQCETSNFKQASYDGLLAFFSKDGVHTDSIRLYTTEEGGIGLESSILQQIEKIEEHYALREKGLSATMLDSIRSETGRWAERQFRSYILKGSTLKEENKGLAYAIGLGSGFLIYITLFIYGASVMRGVMEEKMNRIAEVMVSSVKPFQLMMGKIIGIAGVGLTQLLLWAVLLMGLSALGSYWLSAETLSQGTQGMSPLSASSGEAAMAVQMLEIQSTVLSADWGIIISCFLFYFIGGYLFYASLFAAIGSVVNEDPQEAQALMMPITMPIIFAFIIMTAAIEQPGGSLAYWGSIIPFTSPIVMMARIPAGVPNPVGYGQLALSMGLLIAGFILTTWLSAKIYRTGILMYGKKANWKEMLKWMMKR